MLKRLPCPFCWSAAPPDPLALIDPARPEVIERVAMRCRACGAQGPIGSTVPEAFDRWNWRGMQSMGKRIILVRSNGDKG